MKIGRATHKVGFFVTEGRSSYVAIFERDWIHTAKWVPSSLHQMVMFWHNGQVETVKAEEDPIFEVNTIEALFYSPQVKPLSMMMEEQDWERCD